MGARWVIPVALALCAAVAQGRPATSQEPPRLKAGERVRVTDVDRRDGRFVGTLVQVTDSSLLVRFDSLHSKAFPLDSVRRVEVSLGTHSYWKAGEVPFAILGAVFGAAIGAGAASRPCGNWDMFCGLENGARGLGGGLLGGAVGMLAGGLVGAGIGSAFRREVWEAVPKTEARPFVAPLTRCRAGIGVSVSF